MNITALVLLVLNVILDSIGQLVFKKAAIDPLSNPKKSRWIHMISRPFIWIGICCYVFEFMLWIAFLSLVPLSQGVLLGSINIVVVMLLGRFFFREKISILRVLGILAISVGVLIVGFKG